MWLNELVQKNKLEEPIYIRSASGPDESLTWEYYVSIKYKNQDFAHSGYGATCAEAKREACQKIKDEIESKTVSNAIVVLLCYSHDGKNYHTDRCKESQRYFGSKIEFMKYLKKEYPATIDYTSEARETMRSYRCVTILDEAINTYINRTLFPKMKSSVDTLLKKFEATGTLQPSDLSELDHLEQGFQGLSVKPTKHIKEQHVKSNMQDMPIEPAGVSGVMQQDQMAQIPNAPNPQYTQVLPVVRHNAEQLISSVEVGTVQTLNPAGAKNMLSVGGILFDIKTMIYTQYLDADKEWSCSESVPTGGIIFQIP